MATIDRRGITVGEAESAVSLYTHSGLGIKAACVTSTTSNITLSGLQTLDGVAVTDDQRVLVKDQTDASENGIYDVSSGNWTRSGNFDSQGDIAYGTLVFVAGGGVGGEALWYVDTANPITLGTSGIDFVGIPFLVVSGGVLGHEQGGLEANVSAFSGLVKISGGETSAVSEPAGDLVGTSATQTLTNKTLDADSSTVTNIGSSEVKSELITGLSEEVAPETGDFLMGYNGSALVKVDIGNLPGGGSGVPNVIMEDQKTSGTEGGTFTSGSWQTRTLNTEVSDTDSLVSISSNQFTPTVSGYVSCIAPAYKVGAHQIRLFNVTDTAVSAIGPQAVARDSDNVQTTAHVGGFVIAGKAYRIEHRCATTKAVNGYGQATSWGTEVYTSVVFWRDA